jgi:monoterpene epsilon-lactone hydrolase
MTISIRAKAARHLLARVSNGPERTVDEARERMDQLDRLPRPRHVDYVDTLIGGVPAIVATPTAVEPTRHLLYIHGGAYVMGSPKSHIAMVANLAKRASATATVIEYRLAPEHVYPAAIDDCLAAYRALIVDVDPAVVTIAGDSAGGGAALSTLATLRDAGDPLPAAAYLLSPWTDLTGSGESVITRAAADPMIDGAKIAEAGRVYAGEVPLDDPGVSPLFADLAGLPPMLIQTGMDEVLLSDSTRLADEASEAGVEVTLDLADGMWHVYQSFARMMPEATDALVRAAVFMRSRTPTRLADSSAH